MNDRIFVKQDEESWDAGYKAGLAGEPTDQPPKGVDRLSWYSGVIEGQAHRNRDRTIGSSEEEEY